MRHDCRKSEAVRYVRRNFDEMLVLGALAKFVYRPDEVLTPDEETVLRAFQRSVGSLRDAGPDEVRAYLRDMDPSQIDGTVNNVKGVLHEMEFVEMENADGDTITAELYPATNHPGYDIVMTDASTGETWDVQLKATDSVGYVQDWMDAHPDGEILVTDELAEEMDLPSTGMSDEGVTVRVEDFVDRIQDAPDDAPFWTHLPWLTAISLSLVALELYRRYRRGEMTATQMRRKLALATGLKAAKLAALVALLSIPVVNVVVAAGLVAKLIWTADTALRVPRTQADPVRNSGLHGRRPALPDDLGTSRTGRGHHQDEPTVRGVDAGIHRPEAMQGAAGASDGSRLHHRDVPLPTYTGGQEAQEVD